MRRYEEGVLAHLYRQARACASVRAPLLRIALVANRTNSSHKNIGRVEGSTVCTYPYPNEIAANLPVHEIPSTPS